MSDKIIKRMEKYMNKGMSVTPEMLEKIDKAHAVSSSIMKNFKAQEPVAAVLAKFNPVTKEASSDAPKASNTKPAISKPK